MKTGTTVRFDASVANAGPGSATSTAVAFVFDATLSPSMAAIPAGWACAAPVQGADATTVTCTTSALDAGRNAAFAIDAVAPAASAGGMLRLGVAARSQTADPANADNTASVAVKVYGRHASKGRGHGPRAGRR